jgi:excisionase family DNA binding protein
MTSVVISMPPSMTPKQAAEVLKVHTDQVLAYIKQGRLPAGQPGRSYVIRTQDVLKILDEEVIEATAERLQALPQPAPAKPGQSRARRVLGRSPAKKGAQ